MKSLLRMLGLIRVYPVRLAWFVAVSVGYAVCASSFTFVSKTVTDILAKRAPPDWAASFGPWMDTRRAFFCLLGATAVLLLLKCAFQYGQRYLRAWLTQRVVLDTQKQLADHLLGLDLGFFQQERAGDLLSRLTNDLRLLGMSVKLACILLTRPLTLLALLIWIVVLDWRLALLGLIGAPLGAMVIRVLSRKMHRASKAALEKRADLTSVMVQFLMGMRVVKAFGCEDFEREQFGRQNRKLFDISMKRERARALTRPVVEFVSAFGALLALAVGGEWVLNGKIEFGDLTGFVTALFLMYQPAKEITKANNDLQQAIPGADRVFHVMDLQAQVQAGDRALTAFEDGIAFERVSFAYQPGIPVLQEIDLNIRKGECVALVGPSGAGKSTVTDLLLRFFDPAAGRICIDGIDLRELSFESLREKLALVGQEPFLFNSSVRDNIAYGRADASEEAIERAARAANVHEEILGFSAGYDTVVGERGENLSGGQRQRVAIARALFKDAPILVLDEATSSLDSRSERQVQEALDHLMEGRTSLVIAHRLSTVRHADRIVVLERGRITAEGRHEELLATSPIYAYLVELQGEPQARQGG